MNTADYVILGIIIISALMSIRRGFVKEAFSLATWISAFLIAHIFSHSLAMLLAAKIETHSVRMALAWVALLVSTLFVGGLISRVATDLVRVVGLGSTDKIFGFVFGIARGLLLNLIAVGLLNYWGAFKADPWWQQSTFIPHFTYIDQWTKDKSEFLIDRVTEVAQSYDL